MEPGLLRVFRYFTVMAMLYFALVFLYGQVEMIHAPVMQVLSITIPSYLNLVTYIILFGYLSVPWLRRKLGPYFLPLAIIYAVATPMFSNLIYLVSPETMDINMVITRSWVMFPILLPPLVFTAWQYPYRYMVLFAAAATFVMMGVLLPFVGGVNRQTIPLLGVPIVMGFAFGLVGSIVNQIVNEQRRQKKELIEANIKLSEYALTLEELAVTRERNRLARELHDTVAHTLSGLSVNLEAIKIMLKGEQSEVTEMIDHALLNTRNGLDETRRALRDLRPKTLEDLGLRLSILHLAEAASQRGAFKLDQHVLEEFPHFSPGVEQAIYRIVQESFQNIVRHASASQVMVRTNFENSHFHIYITDDGVGFERNENRPSNEFGLDGMRERADISGGVFEVISSPEQGTIVHLKYEVPDGTSNHM